MNAPIKVKLDVTNRFTGAVQFTAEIDCDESADFSIKLGLAVKWAVKAGADLAGADLADADLAGADLADADLTRAYLARANLTGANLAGANLTGAYLTDAYLAGANLARANLTGANLAGANLAGAYLTDAYLARANLTGANLAGARLIDGGQRSDGYRFVGWVKGDNLMIRAGCRDFTIEKAREHWRSTRGGTPLGDETFCILDHIEAVARIRGMTGAKSAEAA